MNRRNFIMAASASLAIPFIGLPRAAFAAASYATLLGAIVKPDDKGYNRVSYKALASQRADLDAIVADLQAQSPSSLSKAGAKAYWINLYNAVTLKVVADHYPVKSIKDIKLGGGGLFGSGPWRKELVTVEGRALSLDNIEHDILRKTYKDPFVHYALNCASYSCPNLAAKPYTADNTSALMRENAMAYVNHPRGVDVKDGAITASKIYSWYAGDFGGKLKLKPHWQELATAEKATAIADARVAGYDYDWTLNNV